MPSYNLNVLGRNVSFKAEADHERIEEAKQLVETWYRKLDHNGKQVSKEKLLIFLALGLADDLLQCNQKLGDLEERLSGLLMKIDDVDEQ